MKRTSDEWDLNLNVKIIALGIELRKMVFYKVRKLISSHF